MRKLILPIMLLVVVSGCIGQVNEIPLMIRGYMNALMGTSEPCTDNPYNWICTCPIDKEKTQDGSKFYCISHSPKASTDCDWCNKECIEWQKVWEEYGISYGAYCTDRTPMSGQACIARISEFGNLECVAVPMINQEGLITFCSDDALAEVITEWQGTDEELVQFFRSGCPVPGINPYDQCELEFGGGSGVGIGPNGEVLSIVECRSACKDTSGRVVGGRVLWSVWWLTETREIWGQPDGGWYDTDCISGV